MHGNRFRGQGGRCMAARAGRQMHGGRCRRRAGRPGAVHRGRRGSGTGRQQGRRFTLPEPYLERRRPVSSTTMARTRSTRGAKEGGEKRLRRKIARRETDRESRNRAYIYAQRRPVCQLLRDGEVE